MAASSLVSFLLSTLLAVITFAIMQVYKVPLGATQPMTLVGGFLGSVFFLFMLTALSNMERAWLGEDYKTGLFPEVIACLFISMLVSGFVHRVCATVCLLVSLAHLYYVNQLSNSVYGPAQGAAAPVAVAPKRKK
ncbi:protein KRTCAP2 homolog [Corticium candelabrum]|uniref:protein KRTCAP2 homolog n=1 Tax=Corticium candelabrum TaxID=121492 RepID=UPI002E264BB2|nr:protein KRTCAP2 homolog [Corticium candelabrum]